MENKLTFGEKAVGLGFNPSGDTDVQEIKELCARLINKIEDRKLSRQNQSYLTHTVDGEAVRRLIDAQMWAVKSITLGEE